MLLGFPLDSRNNDNIHNALASFGRMIVWENNRDHLTKLMVRAHVINLQDVPYFLVLTEVEGFQGNHGLCKWKLWSKKCWECYQLMRNWC
jgi:hypothetical protein